ncbi:uncharacterized protein DS421_14g456400 [Arachis hypogaea]|nr:uncharacterized protein DS421_14g456400 [Arachis hypogaea]
MEKGRGRESGLKGKGEGNHVLGVEGRRWRREGEGNPPPLLLATVAAPRRSVLAAGSRCCSSSSFDVDASSSVWVNVARRSPFLLFLLAQS